MSLFGDDSSSDAGEIALLEQKKIKRVISEMHEDLQAMKGRDDIIRSLQESLNKLEGSVSVLIGGQGGVTVNAGTKIDGRVDGDVVGGDKSG